MAKARFVNGLRNRLLCSPALAAVAAGCGLMLSVPAASALNLYNGSSHGNNLEINLTTTLSYTGMQRVNSPSQTLLSQDGDSNFQHGIVANLISAVPVLDIRDGNYGAHFSGQFYVNTPYLGTNQNDRFPYSDALYTAKQTDFASGTRNVDGLNAQALDAFVFAQHEFAGDQMVQLKVGRSTLYWGQSLFFADGISGEQAPIDIITLQNQINPQFQQFLVPTGQAILTYEPRPGTTFQGYYQFQWQPDQFQGEGAYFNASNFMDAGGGYLRFQTFPANSLYPGFPGGSVGLTRAKDLRPESQNGVFGLSAQQTAGAWDLGIFLERFDAHDPEIGIAPFGSPTPVSGANPASGALSIGQYLLAYPRDIWLQGVSFSTNVGPANVAGELSFREHQPLLNQNRAYYIAPGQNTNGNPGYPVGTTWNAQFSSIYLSPPLPLDPGGVTLTGEVVINHLIAVTQNRWVNQSGLPGTGLTTGFQATAAAFDVQATPTYNNVLPNLQLTFPISVKYNFLGRSVVDPSLYHGTAIFNAGMTATYNVNWIASLSYQDYLGKPDPIYNGLADRGFVALNLQHTF